MGENYQFKLFFKKNVTAIGAMALLQYKFFCWEY